MGIVSKVFAALSAALALVACASTSGAPSAPAAKDAVAAALADPARPEADKADDARRKPSEGLAFMGVAPGMTVFELEAGAGWYTELLSRAVGPKGAVWMQNPVRFKDRLAARFAARLGDGRLPNVRQTFSNFDALEAPSGSVDLAVWVQGPHEVYFHPNGESLGDPAKSYAEVFRILKKGGAFVVIDHAAVAGAPETTGDTLHRVDRAIVVARATEAGFRLEGESAFLANPADDRTKNVFDKDIRGYTDQFALRFVKR